MSESRLTPEQRKAEAIPMDNKNSWSEYSASNAGKLEYAEDEIRRLQGEVDLLREALSRRNDEEEKDRQLRAENEQMREALKQVEWILSVYK